jgi:Fe2+ or Zn2+ uptake regulation protein
MSVDTYRTCQNCGTENLNRDYCKNCGEIININLKRKLERQQKAKEKSATQKVKKKNKITLFFEDAKQHENIVIRYTARFFCSIWIVVLAIGSFLALVFGYIAA